MDINLIREYERLDDLEIKGLKVIQNPDKFCFGIDAVLLANFANIRNKEEVADFCTGTGVIPLLLYAKYSPELIKGIEIQKDIADMAKRSVEFNGLNANIDIIYGDIKNIKDILQPQSLNVITCNPPYMKESLKNEKESLSIARHEIACNIEDVVFAAKFSLKQGGRLYLVHRPNRLVEIMEVLKKHKMEVKRMRFVHPFLDKEANLVLIEAVKGGGAWLKTEAPLIVYEKNGTYTEEILKIYGKV